MSVTTDTIEAIREGVIAADDQHIREVQISILIDTIGQLTTLVEKLHARILVLEIQQACKENY